MRRIIFLLMVFSSIVFSQSVKAQQTATVNPLKLILTLHDHMQQVTSIDWSPNGTKVVNGTSDGKITIWNLDSAQAEATLEQSTYSISSVAWSPDGTEIAVGASFDNAVHIWDVTSQQEVITLYGHGDSVNSLDGQGILSVELKPDSSILASGGWDMKARTWDVSYQQDKKLSEFDGQDLGGVKVAWSPSGDLLAGLSHPYFTKQVQIWDSVTGKLEQTIVCDVCASFGSFAWSPDGDMMALGGEYGESGGAVMLYETKSATFIRALFEHVSTIKDVDWNQTGQIAAMGHSHINIWDSAEANTPMVLDVTDPTVIKWSPDGKWLAVGSQDGTITIWEQN